MPDLLAVALMLAAFAASVIVGLQLLDDVDQADVDELADVALEAA